MSGPHDPPRHLLLPRFSASVRYRLLFLAVGNVALLTMIAALLEAGGSFRLVLSKSLVDCAPLILAGLGMTGVIFCGAIDVSVGGIVAAAASVFGALAVHKVPPAVCFAACVATGWALSMLNGYLVSLLRVPAIIVTLAGLAFYRGVALIVADLGITDFAGNIQIYADAYQAPGKVYAAWILAVAVGVALVFEVCGVTPRRWLALGNSPEACRLQGLSPNGIRQSAFFVGGLFLGLGCLVAVTQVEAIEPARIRLGFELNVIGAVVLGGSNIFGGEGSYAGTILGAFFLYFLEQALYYFGVSPYVQSVIVGMSILSVIGLDCFLSKRRKLREEIG